MICCVLGQMSYVAGYKHLQGEQLVSEYLFTTLFDISQN